MSADMRREFDQAEEVDGGTRALGIALMVAAGWAVIAGLAVFLWVAG